MTNTSKHEQDYERAEILTVSPEQRRRIGRRWVCCVLAIQALILIVRLAGDWYAYWVGPPGDSLFRGWIWVANFWLWLAAGVLWPTTVVVPPMIVAIACIASAETRTRTLACVLLSIALTGIPLLLWREAPQITGPP